MQEDREFAMPTRKRAPGWVWLLALLVHVPFAFLFVRHYLAVPPEVFQAHDIVMHDSVRAIPMPFSRDNHRAPLAPQRQPAAPPVAVAPRTTPDVIPPVSAAIANSPVVDSAPSAPTNGLRPRYGDGRLWVQPMVASPREIASRLTGQTQQQMTDSVVNAMVQAYLNTMAEEQRNTSAALPSWTTKIGGKTVGLDSKWIYLGPLKIPTALLALLPINVQGNPTQAQYNAKLQLMRADLLDAARRAANYDEFKKAVKDLRQQTEDRRQFKKNQQTPPDSGHHG